MPKIELFAIAASHPCAAVERGLQLKGLPYKRIDLPPVAHIPHQLALFHRPTVPGLRDPERKTVGSRAIMRRLDELAPKPALLPSDDPIRAKRIEDAEWWGEEILQKLGRRMIWRALQKQPSAMISYSKGSNLAIPVSLRKPLGYLVLPVAVRRNDIQKGNAYTDLFLLRNALDRVDRLLNEKVIGNKDVNAADLQIASTLRILLTIEDLIPFFAGRPAHKFTLELFPQYPGCIPAGSLPKEWLAEL